MWTFQPLVPNIYLPTHEDAQEDFGASIICLLYSLWPQWEKDFYSKLKNHTFLGRLLCFLWFLSLESINSLLVTDWDAETASSKTREEQSWNVWKPHLFLCWVSLFIWLGILKVVVAPVDLFSYLLPRVELYSSVVPVQSLQLSLVTYSYFSFFIIFLTEWQL